MLEPVKTCATCKNLQDRASYCHKRKETRYKPNEVVECDDWVKSYRSGWRDIVKDVTSGGMSSKKKYDPLAWCGVD